MNVTDKWGSAAVCDMSRKWLTENRAPCRPGVEPALGRGEWGGAEAVPARRSGEGGHQWLRPAGSPAAGRAPAERAGCSGQRPPPGDVAHPRPRATEASVGHGCLLRRAPHRPPSLGASEGVRWGEPRVRTHPQPPHYKPRG